MNTILNLLFKRNITPFTSPLLIRYLTEKLNSADISRTLSDVELIFQLA